VAPSTANWHGSAQPIQGPAEAARIIDGVVTPTAQEDTMGQMKEFAGLHYREGALDPKTLQLVALAAMALSVLIGGAGALSIDRLIVPFGG